MVEIWNAGCVQNSSGTYRILGSQWVECLLNDKGTDGWKLEEICAMMNVLQFITVICSFPYIEVQGPWSGEESLSPVNRIKNNECLYSDGLTNNSASLVENTEIYWFIFRWHLFSGMLWIAHCTWPSDWLPFKHPGHAIYLQTVGCYFEVQDPQRVRCMLNKFLQRLTFCEFSEETGEEAGRKVKRGKEVSL